MQNYHTDADHCDCCTIHDDVVNEVREKMLNDDTYIDMAELFKVFSDSTRIKIMGALLNAEMCVCDISVVLGMTKSSISHQLRILKAANLVRFRKEGRVIYYSLADGHVKSIMDQGLAHVEE